MCIRDRSRGSPQRLLHSDNYALDEKIKKIYKENNQNENEGNKYKSIFSPLKGGRCNEKSGSERDMMTPKTATFAEISKKKNLLLI